MNAHPDFHHLNIHDIDRAMADAHSVALPLICHEEDCFVDGSELHALIGVENPRDADLTKTALPTRIAS